MLLSLYLIFLPLCLSLIFIITMERLSIFILFRNVHSEVMSLLFHIYRYSYRHARFSHFAKVTAILEHKHFVYSLSTSEAKSRRDRCEL